MEPRKRVIHYYVDRAGKAVVREWLRDLADTKTRARIRIGIDRMEDGNLGDYKSAGEGVIEIRFHFGPGYRLYVGMDGPELILLLCAGTKGSQSRDVQLAHHYWSDYMKWRRRS